MGIPAYIAARIEQKKTDYEKYAFTQVETVALKTFFDLAQEFDGINEFYHLSVAIPKSFYGFDAHLYLVEPRRNEIVLVARSEAGNGPRTVALPEDVKPGERPYYTKSDSLVLTIRGKKSMIDQLPFHAEDEVLGILEVFPVTEREPHRELFFEKYANRIGFSLHNRYIVEKNIEHLRFIRSLVADIEHNIIVPNMVYKLFLRRLRGKVKKNQEIEDHCEALSEEGRHSEEDLKKLLVDLKDVNRGLWGELENLEKHHKNMSLFIETLFRKSHFDQGRLTLRTQQCNMKKDVVQPQLERYLEQFIETGISIDDRLSKIPDEDIVNVVDVGLLAQVYANLFSNALKYAREVEIFGERKKYIAYGHEIVRDFFGPGKDGVKYNVFSSGPHIPFEERGNLFQEGFRATNADEQPGTGHGLAFIKHAIEIHGGVAGYEATDYGNNFYFILPR